MQQVLCQLSSCDPAQWLTREFSKDSTPDAEKRMQRHRKSILYRAWTKLAN